jgi:D-glycero-alpha-D-manno-heptose-7-phosphate kinase
VIVSKTPLRIPLAGGLTDLPGYARRFGGVTVSTTIDKYVYVMLKENLGGYHRLRYQDVVEKVADAAHIKNDQIRECLLATGLAKTPLDIVVMADLAGESGLGMSGALTVGLLAAMHAHAGRAPTPEDLAREAAHIEVEVLETGGYHDPSVTALGGLKRLDYGEGLVGVKAIPLSEETRCAFAESLLFFYGGRHHRSKPSLALLSSRLDDALPTLHAIKEIALDMERRFGAGDLPGIAACVGRMQELKQQLPGNFEDAYVRDVAGRVRETGAYAQLPGGKISAFVIVCCPGGQQGAVRAALKDHREVKLGLEPGGARVMKV